MNKRIISNIIFSVILVLMVLIFLDFIGIFNIFYYDRHPLLLCPGQNKYWKDIFNSGVLFDENKFDAYQGILNIIIFVLYPIIYLVFEIQYFRKKRLTLLAVFLTIFFIAYFINIISYECWAEFFNFDPY
ncbi:MAG: hypothetical protein COX29_03715 [Candidatus Moranbacteria bacterium CG23_combo_of_CG06-09_8_20_14_all_35_22]|nr:MAG: hypothetical protein COX29_03715 [Candidatus Moranbacteria bacterium CG23_combo_of_CG06-09_8_20_14_all_35_22]